MALFINTNVTSLYAQRAAQRANNALDVSFERLASGQRINKAKDDAAGIQVSNNLSNQLNGLTQGNRNAQDAIAFAQTVEGSMDEITNMLQRIRTLAVQSATGTITSSDRKALQEEVNALTDEICRVAEETTFAGADMLNGNASIVRFQLGPDPSSIISFDLRRGFDINGIVEQVEQYNGPLIPNKPVNDEVLDDFGKIRYSDIFKNRTGDEPGISILDQESSQRVLAGIDALITAVDRKRADLGAMQNRLESTVRNQENVKENVANSRSTIRDTDFAEETAKLTSQQIIQQATSTILTQANQRPQIALSLLNQ